MENYCKLNNKNMKTKEEVLKHLSETGYTMKAMNRITGFLIGVSIADYHDVEVKHGEHKWEEFLDWWYNDCQKADVLGDLLAYLAERWMFADYDEQKRVDTFIEFLIDEFGESDENENVNE